MTAKSPNQPPQEINFQAVNLRFTVKYLVCQAKLDMISRPAPYHELVFVGKIANNAWHKKLMLWVREQANLHLTQQLKSAAEKTQLYYRDVSVRAQRTVWGSCNPQKMISLNYKLIFLPPNLLQHILIHELCHTKEMNHSSKFWQLVASFDENWQQHKKELRRANQYIPAWAG